MEKIARVYVNATSGYATLDLAVQNTMVWSFLTQMNLRFTIVKRAKVFLFLIKTAFQGIMSNSIIAFLRRDIS